MPCLRSSRREVFAVLLCASFHVPAWAAGTWVPLTEGAAPGTPAEILLDPKSDSQRTLVEVRIHGFYSEKVKGPDGQAYQRLEFPGLAPIGQVGAPMLPMVRFRLGLVTSAPAAEVGKVEVLAQKTFKNMHVWPQPVEGAAEVFDPTQDPGPGDSDGVAETFAKDPALYKLKTPWPPQPVEPSPKKVPMAGAVQGVACGCMPVSWNPFTGDLIVAAHVRYSYDHPGAATPLPQCTKDQYKFRGAMYLNAGVLKAWWLQDLVAYAGRYLIVTGSDFVSTVQPLVEQKKKCGFHVQVKTIAAGTSATGVRQVIADWYEDGSASADHYCLLVGDTDLIPQRFKPGIGYDGGDVWTDDEYGSPLDLDLDEEVYVGRLSVDDAADLEAQIGKILDYENQPSPLGRYDRALLVGHKGGSNPSGFEMSLDVIQDASYAVDPDFQTAYGNDAATNAMVVEAIEKGLGLVCYEGHGSSNAWSGWSSDSFHKNEVIGLDNTGIQPVVWSLCCSNMNLQLDPGATEADCIGETWMEVAPTGAVASYAATTISWVKQNHSLAQNLFKAVFEEGLTRHGQAIAWAEARAKEDWPNQTNPWMYLLLGDPSMHVRRTPPYSIALHHPLQIPLCQAKDCFDLVFEVKLPPGPPVEGALVALWKPGAGGVAATDEVLINGYTDAAGIVHLPVSPKSAGKLHYTVRDGDTMLATGTIAVTPCADAGINKVYGQGKAGTQGIPKLAALDLPTLGAPTVIELANARPGALPVLILGAQSAALPFDAGTLLVQPLLLLPLSVPVGADGTLKIGGKVPGDPGLCGLKLYHQVIFTDAGAAGFYHQAMTNGLLRVFGS